MSFADEPEVEETGVEDMPSGSEEEKAADPAKEDTGLFFFKGNPGGRFAVCNAGGAFAYVGAMQDSFPMRWSCPNWDIMRLPCFTGPVRRRLVRICPEPFNLFLNTPRNGK